jgi:hypothetical protein
MEEQKASLPRDYNRNIYGTEAGRWYTHENQVPGCLTELHCSGRLRGGGGVSSLKERNIAINPDGLGFENDCAGEAQQQL